MYNWKRLTSGVHIWHMYNLEPWNLEPWNLEPWNTGTWNPGTLWCLALPLRTPWRLPFDALTFDALTFDVWRLTYVNSSKTFLRKSVSNLFLRKTSVKHKRLDKNREMFLALCMELMYAFWLLARSPSENRPRWATLGDAVVANSGRKTCGVLM